MNFVKFAKKYLLRLFILILFTLFFGWLYKIYIPRLAAFGCFDDCFNYSAGYFINQGKMLYRDLFFNHAPIPAYLSAVIQSLTNPENIYELLLRHRQFVFLFAFFSTILLYLRFGSLMLFFSLIYETSKFYLFGDRFLAEGIIIYPLIYLIGLAWYTINNIDSKSLSRREVIAATICSLFIIYMREPFAPATLLLFTVILWNNSYKKIMLFLFGFLGIIPLLFFPIKDIWFNLITINRITILADTINNSSGLLNKFSEIFFYPLIIYLRGEWTIIRYVLITLTSLLTVGGILLHKQARILKTGIFFFFVLGLLNNRPVVPGAVFYSSFHLLPWYAALIFLVLLIRKHLLKNFKKIGRIFSLTLVVLILYLFTSPQIFFRENINSQEELVTQYSQEIQYSYAIEHLAKSSNTIFIDGFAELIHWKVKLPTVYKYSWYTSVMPVIPLYSQARLEMFKNNPPDFYFGSCPNEINISKLMPDKSKAQYLNIPMENKPSCLWIHKNVLPQISEAQWLKANELLFSKPL